MNPSVGDSILISYNDRVILVKVNFIRGSTVYLRDEKTDTDSSITWDKKKKMWILPNGEEIPMSSTHIIAHTSGLPTSTPNFSFTGHELTDIEILKYLENNDFERACRTSKYAQSLCNGTHNNYLYKERIAIHYPAIYRQIEKIEKINWRELYYKIIKWLIYRRKEFYKDLNQITIISYVDFNNVPSPSNLPEIIVFFIIYPHIRADLQKREIEKMFKQAAKNGDEETMIWLVQNDKLIEPYLGTAFQYGYEKYINAATLKFGHPNTYDIKEALLNNHLDLFKKYNPTLQYIIIGRDGIPRTTDDDYPRIPVLRISIPNVMYEVDLQINSEMLSKIDIETLKYFYENGYRATENVVRNLIQKYNRADLAQWIIENTHFS
ncbi:MAG: hypothetical protein Solivirus1_81 [Solivirus sp.]|uniref:Uncharacterized protein n=1 Tax=Solivirus sp. TaxID=2487772 RepID=A0A3G5AH56_9VIRU|nr:MAG: hypothetical protein Solivirus1_81 [Solivirus sp.]